MSEPKPEYEVGETPRTWAKVTKSSSKDGSFGFEYGCSNPSADAEGMAATLEKLRRAVRAELKEWQG